MKNGLPHQGKLLVKLLQEQDKTQSWLAGELDVTRQQIQKWTQMKGWRTTTVYKIARALGVDTLYFFDGVQEEERRGAVGTATDRPRLNNQGNAASIARRASSRQ
jgi:transcriptional regulator with XRE-family HTH domain